MGFPEFPLRIAYYNKVERNTPVDHLVIITNRYMYNVHISNSKYILAAI